MTRKILESNTQPIEKRAVMFADGAKGLFIQVHDYYTEDGKYLGVRQFVEGHLGKHDTQVWYVAMEQGTQHKTLVEALVAAGAIEVTEQDDNQPPQAEQWEDKIEVKQKDFKELLGLCRLLI